MTETTIGWTTLTAANSYFSTERLDSTYWDALTAVSGGKDERSAVLKMAYNRIRFCKEFVIPVTPAAADLEKLALAQHETAYYLAQHSQDEDKRKGLQAQAVSQAGIVKETYAEADLDKIPLPAIVYQVLFEFLYAPEPFFAIDIDRREDLGAGDNVVGLEDEGY